jgi:hypothetical protein
MTTDQKSQAGVDTAAREGSDPAHAGATKRVPTDRADNPNRNGAVAKGRAVRVRVELDPLLAAGRPTTGYDETVPTARPERVSGAAMTRAGWALTKACEGIRERMAAEGHPQEEAVLAAIDEYRQWLKRNCALPLISQGVPDVAANLARVRCGDATVTSRIAEAVASLADLAGQDSPYYRSDADPEVDVLIDIYKVEMEDRGHGLPRSGWTARKCWRTAAKEIGCSEKQLTERRRRRLLMIDAELEDGKIVGSKHIGHMRAERIDVAVEMIREECERRRGRMPADPLEPDRVDEVEIAEGAGVAVRDFAAGARTREVRAMLENARDGKALVPHPLVAARRFDYEHLKAEGRKLRAAEAEAAEVDDVSAAARITVGALTKFMSLQGTGATLRDKVPLDFPEQVERALATEHGFDSGWPAQMRRWVKYYHEVRSARPLPEAFQTAIKIMAAEVGLTRRDLVNRTSRAVEGWLREGGAPPHESQAILDKVEDVVKATRGRLSGLLAREWRSRRLSVGVTEHGYGGIARKLPLDLAEKSGEEMLALMRDTWMEFEAQNTAFSRRHSARVRDHYRLPFDDWPCAMQDAWQEQVPRTTERTAEEPDDGGLREAGSRPSEDERHSTMKEEDRSWSKPTTDMGEFQFGFLFGFLTRPTVLDEKPARSGRRRPAQPLEASDKPFEPEPGLGLPRELIHPALLAVVDLFTLYGHWKRSRSGGRFAPSTAATLRLAAAFLKPKTGLVWRNPGWLKDLERFHSWWSAKGRTLPKGQIFLDIEAFREDWHGAVEEAYECLCLDIKDLTTRKRKGGPRQPVKLRDPFIPLAGYLAESDPLQAYMVGVRQMLASRPLSMLERHEHQRNSILTLIAIQTGLRAGNLLLTVSGPEPTLRREMNIKGKVRWRVVIPATQFKNWFSPFFSDGQPYEFILDDEDDLYERLDDYMSKGRRYLLAGKESNALFVTRMGNDCTVPVLSDIYRGVTRRFFVYDKETGMGVPNVRPHGLHSVRHIIATSLLLTTRDIYQAAYAIQDTTTTVERNYVKYLPKDKAQLAVAQMRRSRAAANDDEKLPTAA